jgi:hypothetical protein
VAVEFIPVVTTIQPSAILRGEHRDRMYRGFVADLRARRSLKTG